MWGLEIDAAVCWQCAAKPASILFHFKLEKDLRHGFTEEFDRQKGKGSTSMWVPMDIGLAMSAKHVCFFFILYYLSASFYPIVEKLIIFKSQTFLLSCKFFPFHCKVNLFLLPGWQRKKQTELTALDD